MSLFKTLLRRLYGKQAIAVRSTSGLLDLPGCDRLEGGVRWFHRCPGGPDFHALARAIARAPDQATADRLLMEMLALLQREVVVARETGCALGATHGAENRGKHDADPGFSARATWWS